LTVECLDIEAAFLEGDIDEPIFIEFKGIMNRIHQRRRDENALCRARQIHEMSMLYDSSEHSKQHLTVHIGMINQHPCVFYLKDEKWHKPRCFIVDMHHGRPKDAIEQFKIDGKRGSI
jgi:hypothetical protein